MYVSLLPITTFVRDALNVPKEKAYERGFTAFHKLYQSIIWRRTIFDRNNNHSSTSCQALFIYLKSSLLVVSNFQMER